MAIIFKSFGWVLLALVGLWLLASLAAGIVAPFSPNDIVGSMWAGAFWQQTSEHSGNLLGTDQLGRDLLSRLLYGTRNTMIIALSAAFAAFALGMSMGFWAAIARGRVDMVLSRIVDLIIAIPTLITTLLVIAAVGPSTGVLIAIIAVVDGARVYRLARLVAMNATAMEYFESARLRGERLPWLMIHEILPNVRMPIITEFGLRFCYIFLFIAALSFLGLGIQPPAADLGSMVRENASAISFGVLAPFFPAFVISSLAIATNFFVEFLARHNR
ncbi:ABC transporter permease [Roseibium litorale]|uniref:ABC transporter permease n=1 Tax=Roseibium litorale TaxID=2803841 RepID=A0ABR9CS48_9HYPH|nr:ABC transporter permease [Roseibium litorale]MBD8893662.1 ABC transporter permease [Roseibium litorale]